MADSTIVASSTDSLSVLKALFDQYGLGELATAVVKYQTDPQFKNDKGDIDTSKAMEDLRQQPTYRSRFAAKIARDELIKKAAQSGQFTLMQPIDERGQLSLEQEYAKKAQQAGLPAGFYDNPQDFVNLITNDVSVNEYTTRIDMAQQAALQSNDALRQQLKQQYGIQEGDLTAFYLDPNRAREVTAQKTNDVVRQFNQAALQVAGFTPEVAAQVAQQSVPSDVNASLLQQQAGQLIGLTKESVGGEQAALSQSQLANVLTSSAQGLQQATDVQAQQALLDAQKRQNAKYSGGGQVAATAQGVVGLTQANI